MVDIRVNSKEGYDAAFLNDNFIVIDTPDALLICPKDEAKLGRISTLLGLPEYEDYR